MITKQEITDNFMADLKNLLGRYKAEITAEDHWQGYAECGRDIRMTVSIDGQYDKDGETISEMTEIDLGTFVDYPKLARIAQDAPADGQTLEHTPPPRPSEPEATAARI